MIKKVGVQFILALVFLFGISTSLKAQPGNLPAPYCMPLYGQSPCNQPGPSNMPGNFLNDFIHSVLTFSGNVDINNPNTGCNSQNFPSIGFRNYIYHKCQHNLSVSAGQVVSFSIQIGNINPQGVAAFIDWNNDNIFSAAPEKIGWSTGTVPAGGWLTFTTTIPPAQPNGTYRLRVRCAFGISGATIDPCNNYSCGEVEDYDVYVGTTSPVISNVVASSNSTLCSGNTLSLNLTYTSQCSPSYTWVGPNSFVSNSQNPTIVNAQPINSGNYTVTVSCGTACPVSLTTSVTIYQSPTTANAGSIICTCATMATLNGNAPSIGTGSWTLISGALTITNPTLNNTGVTAIAIGTNIIQWTITNSNCTSTSTTAVIRDANPSTSAAGPSQTIFCVNSATMAGNTPVIGIGTWSLISGSGTFVSPNSPNSLVTGVGVGTNVYMWIISNNTWCSCQPSTSSTMAVVNATAVNVFAIASPTAVCNGFSTTVTGFGANSYTWTGSSFAGSIIQPSINVGAGSYTVIGSSGSCSDTASVVIYTLSPPVLTLTASSYTHCPNKPISMSVSGASFYTWSPCAGGYLSICTGAGVNAFAPTTMTYTVVGNVLGCSATATIVISVIPEPTITATANQSLICAGDPATLTASGGVNYTWTPSGNGTVNVVSPTVTTMYSVYGTGTNVCIGTGVVTQNVSPCTNLLSGDLNVAQIKVFPNPFKDELKIVSEKLIRIKLLDVSGKEVLRKEINGEVNINTTQLAKGIYFIQVIGDPSVKPIKVIKG